MTAVYLAFRKPEDSEAHGRREDGPCVQKCWVKYVSLVCSIMSILSAKEVTRTTVAGISFLQNENVSTGQEREKQGQYSTTTGHLSHTKPRGWVLSIRWRQQMTLCLVGYTFY